MRREGTRHVTAFELPRIPALLWHATPKFLEGVIAPVAVFYVALVALGFDGALIAAVAWVYTGIIWRLVRRSPVPGTLMLAASGVTVRAVLAAATGSPVVYFLQPTLGTLMVSAAFLMSVPLRRPLIQKLAADMVPLPEAFMAHPLVRRFFMRITLLWALVFLMNTGVSLWLLLSQSIEFYLWVRTGLVTGMGAVAIGISILGFKRCLRQVRAAAS
jgi:hypothetical protein